MSIDPSYRLQVAFLGTENNPVDIAVPSINLVTYDDDMVAFTGIGYGSSINIFGETLLKGYVRVRWPSRRCFVASHAPLSTHSHCARNLSCCVSR